MRESAAGGDIPDTGIPAAIAADMSMAEQHDWHRAYLRRHPVSRRNFLGGAAAAATIAAIGVSPSVVARTRRGAADGCESPVGFGTDGSTQLRLSAQLSRNPNATRIFVDHGPTPDLGASVEAEIRHLVTQISTGMAECSVPNSSTARSRWGSRRPRRTSIGGGLRWFHHDVLSAATAMPNSRDAMGPFRFTMIGDQGTDQTPVLPPGLPPGIYDDAYYQPDNDPTAAAHRAVTDHRGRPDFTCSPTIARGPLRHWSRELRRSGGTLRWLRQALRRRT